jgi:hypothetical protein
VVQVAAVAEQALSVPRVQVVQVVGLALQVPHVRVGQAAVAVGQALPASHDLGVPVRAALAEVVQVQAAVAVGQALPASHVQAQQVAAVAGEQALSVPHVQALPVQAVLAEVVVRQAAVAGQVLQGSHAPVLQVAVLQVAVAVEQAPAVLRAVQVERVEAVDPALPAPHARDVHRIALAEARA